MLGRIAWGVVQTTFFRFSPRPAHAWRALLLRLFGARLGARCHIYAGARIWAPWNLVCDDDAAIADHAEIYNVARVKLGARAVVSQGAYLCSATHLTDDPSFPLVAAPIEIGAKAWIAARAVVMPGVEIGEGAVLGLGALATRDLDPWRIYVGNPARAVRSRAIF